MKFHIKTFKQRHYCLPLWQRLWNAQEGRCFYCGDRMWPRDESKHDDRATIDHFFPRAVVGSGRLMNSVLCHHRCNQVKASRYPQPKEVAHFLKIWALVDVYEIEVPWVDVASKVRLANRIAETMNETHQKSRASAGGETGRASASG